MNMGTFTRIKGLPALFPIILTIISIQKIVAPKEDK